MMTKSCDAGAFWLACQLWRSCARHSGSAKTVTGAITGPGNRPQRSRRRRAHVTAENTANCGENADTTNGSGSTPSAFLPIGTYTVTIEARGSPLRGPPFALETTAQLGSRQQASR